MCFISFNLDINNDLCVYGLEVGKCEEESRSEVNSGRGGVSRTWNSNPL